MERITRLTLSDLSSLRYETVAAPVRFGALVVLGSSTVAREGWAVQVGQDPPEDRAAPAPRCSYSTTAVHARAASREAGVGR
jgi:hypothetical protein